MLGKRNVFLVGPMGSGKTAVGKALARLRTGATPRALEICSGCGGLSLGLKAAGFELSAHIEIDPEAAESYVRHVGATTLSTMLHPWRRVLIHKGIGSRGVR